MSNEKCSKIPDEEIITDIAEALKSRGIVVIVVENRKEAFEKNKRNYSKRCGSYESQTTPWSCPPSQEHSIKK